MLTNLAAVARATRDGTTNEIHFAVDVTCTRCIPGRNGCAIVVQDANDAFRLHRRAPYDAEQRQIDEQIRPGDRLRVQGRVITSEESGLRLGYYYQAAILANGQPPTPLVPTGDELSSGKADFRLVRIHGKVMDVFDDEADPRYMHLFVMHEGSPLLIPRLANPPPHANDRSMIGTDITAVGICEPSPIVSRRFIGRTLVCGSDADMTIARPTDFDLFSADDLCGLYGMLPDQIARAGWHKTTGLVLAAWNGNSFLIRQDPHHTSRIELAAGNPPSAGDYVEVVGIPSTDLFMINLSRAAWRHAKATSVPAMEPAVETTIRDLQANKAGMHRVNSDLHGKTIRFKGRVLDYRGGGKADRMLFLEEGGYLVSVSAGAVEPSAGMPSPGSVVEVVGVYVMDADDWRPNIVFPTIRNFRIVLRGAEDLRTLANPPWLTRQRLLIIIGVLALGIVGIVIWNMSLRVVAERRGRFLFAERAARFGAMQRTAERTRIAIELHDSISQSMHGVAMELETTRRGFESSPDEARRHLDTAMNALGSCHNELRRCLWDLRSDALEEPTMDGAIRRTLLPIVKCCRLDVRFNVPRRNFSDNTAYVVLRIIRELVANAIQHGKAGVVKVAGSMDRTDLLFSVKDNGAGFVPDSRPGPLEGHFGLQGVQDRISRLGGTLTIDSRPGAGCRVAVRIHMAKHAQESMA